MGEYLGRGACKKEGDHLLQSQAMEMGATKSLQPSPKMLMGAPWMHIKRTSAREAAFAF